MTRNQQNDSSTNRFTELINRVYMTLRTIEVIGPGDPNIGELGDRGVVILEYIQERLARQR